MPRGKSDLAVKPMSKKMQLNEYLMEYLKQTGDLQKTLSLARKSLICLEEQRLHNFLMYVSKSFKQKFQMMSESGKQESVAAEKVTDAAPNRNNANQGRNDKFESQKFKGHATVCKSKTVRVLGGKLTCGAEKALHHAEVEKAGGDSLFTAMAGKAVSNTLT